MPKKKKAVNRLRDLAGQHEFVHKAHGSASYYIPKGEAWYQFKLSGFGITYEQIKLSDIPSDAICVTAGYFDRESKDLLTEMKGMMDNAESLEEVVRDAEKKEAKENAKEK